MARQFSIAAIVFSALIFSVDSVGSAYAQDCPRGDLDKAYCDRDGDLVADTPTDPKQLINPGTLVFAYTPVEDPAVYAKAWDGFIKYMEQTT
ncbi:MAG: phosphate/phosphite/phosphonate ABC transporter substrate-binding protein, partial [Betaproteobacteria bacterium]